MTDQKRATNRVLASIPPKQYQRLRAQLEPVTLIFGQVLYQPGKTIRHVYFPVDCLISLLTAVDKRRTLEVGMVGNEGMAGMPFILGMGVSGVRAIVQGGGNALRIDSARFRIEFDRNPPLQQALYRYTYALMAQISQTAACNRFHEAEARLARWLLMTRDRVGSDEFPLTHEFLAHMLGLRREGVTEAASALKRRKLIGYIRGKMQILDARGLKASSCSCYQIVKTAYERAQSANGLSHAPHRVVSSGRHDIANENRLGRRKMLRGNAITWHKRRTEQPAGRSPSTSSRCNLATGAFCSPSPVTNCAWGT